tara:strand:+ start:424 stop:615 length:192 start_codon:yes stop_codon:yes gene_type:complete
MSRQHDIELDKMNQRMHIEAGMNEENEKEKWRRERLKSVQFSPNKDLQDMHYENEDENEDEEK